MFGGVKGGQGSQFNGNYNVLPFDLFDTSIDTKSISKLNHQLKFVAYLLRFCF